MDSTPLARARRRRAAPVLFSLAALASFGTRPAQALGDDVGDGPADAHVLVAGATLESALQDAADHDWFRVAGLAPGPAMVHVHTDGTTPFVSAYDGAAVLLGSGVVPPDGAFVLPVAGGFAAPLHVQLAGATGAYRLRVQVDAPPPGAPPFEPPLPPVSLVDDVPDGVVRDATSPIEGRLELPGDSDTYRYLAGATGPHVVRVLQTDVADLLVRVEEPQGAADLGDGGQDVPLSAGQELRFHVRAAGGLAVGSYRIEVAIRVAPPVVLPAPPPPLPPVFLPLPPPDRILPVDPAQDMLLRAPSAYAAELKRKLGFAEKVGFRLEVLGALAMRERWIARDGGAGLRPAVFDSFAALQAELLRFGPRARLSASYAAYLTQLSAAAVRGGGTRAAIVGAVVRGLDAGRPLLLVGRRADRLLEAWVVIGVEQAPQTALVVLDPSSPGAVLRLRVGDAGIVPQGVGPGAIQLFTLVGADGDALP